VECFSLCPGLGATLGNTAEGTPRRETTRRRDRYYDHVANIATDRSGVRSLLKNLLGINCLDIEGQPLVSTASRCILTRESRSHDYRIA
jgi:hypothetical protein